jgi:hypothetical protein
MKKSTDNLMPFRPGLDDRRNLKGAPKKTPELDELLAEVLSDEQDGKTAAKAILLALVAKAKRGDVRAAELLLNRAYGRVTDKVDLSFKVEQPLFPE